MGARVSPTRREDGRLPISTRMPARRAGVCADACPGPQGQAPLACTCAHGPARRPRARAQGTRRVDRDRAGLGHARAHGLTGHRRNDRVDRLLLLWLLLGGIGGLPHRDTRARPRAVSPHLKMHGNRAAERGRGGESQGRQHGTARGPGTAVARRRSARAPSCRPRPAPHRPRAAPVRRPSSRRRLFCRLPWAASRHATARPALRAPGSPRCPAPRAARSDPRARTAACCCLGAPSCVATCLPRPLGPPRKPPWNFPLFCSWISSRELD